MNNTLESGISHSEFSSEQRSQLEKLKTTWAADASHEKIEPALEDLSPLFDNPLFKKVIDVRANWKNEGLKENWYTMPNSGWSMNKQISMLPDNWSDDELSTWLNQTEEDEKGFNLEYLCQGLVFPIFYDTRLVDGEQRLYAPLYKKNVVDTVSDKERNGSVKQKIIELETYMLQAEEGSLAVITSPAGWSGLEDEQGRSITFPDSQTYMFQKVGKEVKGFTLRTDFTLAEHRSVIKAISGIDLPVDASLTDYVNAISFLSPNNNQKIKSIDDVVQIMEKTRRDESNQTHAYINQSGKEKGKERGWEEAYKSIHNPDLWRFDEKSGEIFNKYRNLVTSAEFMSMTAILRKYGKEEKARELIRDALAITILDIANFLEGEMQVEAILDTRSFISIEEREQAALEIRLQYQNAQYGDTMKRVSEAGGCNGGGDETSFKTTEQRMIESITLRFSTVVDDESDDGFLCPNCNIGKVKGNSCPHCKITKSQWARKTGINCGGSEELTIENETEEKVEQKKESPKHIKIIAKEGNVTIVDFGKKVDPNLEIQEEKTSEIIEEEAA